MPDRAATERRTRESTESSSDEEIDPFHSGVGAKEPETFVDPLSERRRASRSVKLRAASAPGPVRGAKEDGAVEREPVAVDSTRLDGEGDPYSTPACRALSARASTPTNGELDDPPGEVTSVVRRIVEPLARIR